MTRLIIDSDFLAFESASLAQKNSINVIHKKSGREKTFNTRTEFYGHWQKKSGGWLGEQNKERALKGLEPFSADDFDIVDVVEPLPFSHAVNCFNARMGAIVSALGINNFSHYITGGDSWRIDASTMVKYKGNRDKSVKPVHLEEMQHFLVKKCGATVVKEKIRHYNGFAEVDDIVVMEWMNDKKKGIKSIVVQVDKDMMGTGVIGFNPDRMDQPMDLSGIGRIYIDDKKAIRGYGRKWFYFQVLYGDGADNYFANSLSNIKWGEKSAFLALEPCKTDKECLQELVKCYRMLYPNENTIKGWRGDDLQIDWYYALQENWRMAHMLRNPEDLIVVRDVLNRLGVDYGMSL